MSDALATAAAASQLVPANYAEKAMASLMQLHAELMDEKERRVELFRTLMQREQALAELKAYVKLLEEKAAGPRAPERPRPVATSAAPAATAQSAPVTAPVPTAAPARVQVSATLRPPVAPLLGTRPRTDGWKTW